MIPWTFQVPKRYRLSRILDRLGRLAGLAIVRDQQTDRHTDNCLQYANQATQSVAMGRIIHSPRMRCAAIRQQEVGQLYTTLPTRKASDQPLTLRDEVKQATYVRCKRDTARICCRDPVLRRRCCWAPAAVNRYFLFAGRSAANPSHATAAVDRWDRQTDRQTTTAYTVPA